MTTTMTDMRTALDAFRAALGAEHVITDGPLHDAAERATFATTQRVPAVLRPATTAEVQACLRIANEHRVAVYPVSGGKNWGYGSQVPVRDGTCVLHLGRMDRISAFDPKLAHVTVEPGVTFRALHAFLAERRREGAPHLFVSVPGASPDASVLANALERGDGAGPYGDRFAHVCALEVVLPTGECVHTGFARFPDAVAAPLGRWGVGPHLDGLFSQSSLGVVTRMTVWLTPLPRVHQTVFFTVADDARLPAVLEALRALRTAGVLRTTFAVWNDFKALSLVARFPWELTGGRTPLDAATMSRLSLGAWFGRWSGMAPLLSASPDIARAERRLVEDTLGPVVDHLHVDDPLLFPEDEARALGPNLGEPHEVTVASAYWRKRGPLPPHFDPDADRCGMVWFTPALPFDGPAATAAAAEIERIIAAHGFEPHVALACVSERLIFGIISIVYDRDVPGDDARAMACHDELLATMMARGHYPFRLGIQSMDAVPAGEPAYGELLARLKAALDPNGILAPGRYEFRGLR